jgi:hypothetical protein
MDGESQKTGESINRAACNLAVASLPPRPAATATMVPLACASAWARGAGSVSSFSRRINSAEIAPTDKHPGTPATGFAPPRGTSPRRLGQHVLRRWLQWSPLPAQACPRAQWFRRETRDTFGSQRGQLRMPGSGTRFHEQQRNNQARNGLIRYRFGTRWVPVWSPTRTF